MMIEILNGNTFCELVLAMLVMAGAQTQVFPYNSPFQDWLCVPEDFVWPEGLMFSAENHPAVPVATVNIPFVSVYWQADRAGGEGGQAELDLQDLRDGRHRDLQPGDHGVRQERGKGSDRLLAPGGR